MNILFLTMGPPSVKPNWFCLYGCWPNWSKALVASNFFVAEELPDVAVNLIGAGLDDGVHDGAVAASKFGAVGIGLHFEFGDRVHRRLHHVRGAVQHVAQVGIVVDAVEQEVVLQRRAPLALKPKARFNARSGLGGSDPVPSSASCA